MALGTALALVLTTAPAGAHFFPTKAKLVKASLVQSYPPCTEPNTATSSGRQACLATSEVDPSCVFSDSGSGNLSATIKGASILLKASLKNLDSSCNGKRLHATLVVRTTTDDCPTDHCTAVDETIASTSGCTVSNGKCTIKETIATHFPTGAGSEMQVLSCGVQNGDLLTFSCGIMVK
jgi:hypothetical protein